MRIAPADHLHHLHHAVTDTWGPTHGIEIVSPPAGANPRSTFAAVVEPHAATDTTPLCTLVYNTRHHVRVACAGTDPGHDCGAPARTPQLLPGARCGHCATT